MYIEVDLSTVPPALELREPHDLTSFSVRVRSATHAWTTPETIRSLAGDLAAQAEWNERFEKMVAFARQRGWIGDDDSIRAHIEFQPAGVPADP